MRRQLAKALKLSRLQRSLTLQQRHRRKSSNAAGGGGGSARRALAQHR
jgi:hypothetical protein